MKTEVVKVDDGAAASLGRFRQAEADRHPHSNGMAAASSSSSSSSSVKGPAAATTTTTTTPIQNLASWEVAADPEHPALAPLRRAAERLRSSDVPVAFPTETVYGLGADATRSAAVKGIYAAKGRPSDNPLIVHVCDLDMLRSLLSPSSSSSSSNGATTGAQTTGTNGGPATAAADATPSPSPAQDPIPAIYLPLLERFWPGPLTILLRNPPGSRLAPEVTAGLPTFGARMPASPLALTLIKLAGAPLAAPSANASTRPSPTAASHVLDDLGGRLELVLDGGGCGVGVESTVVDGLSDPPAVLRPGGVGIEELRRCPGWEGVQRAYRDEAQVGAAAAAPRAPGMKYKHYSPRARVVLYEGGFGADEGAWPSSGAGAGAATGDNAAPRRVGVVRTRSSPVGKSPEDDAAPAAGCSLKTAEHERREADGSATTILEISLGRDPRDVAQGLFSALRELDARRADVIFVEGVGDGDDIAAAVMNRLRKAASEVR